MPHLPHPSPAASAPACRQARAPYRRRHWTRRALHYGRTRTPPYPPAAREENAVPSGSCLRREAATRYFPAPTAESSLRYLRRAVADDPQLAAELRLAGYRPGSRRLNPRQMRILDSYFG